MSDITSDILALSFDSVSSPSILVNLPEQLYGSHPLGWGIAWYPSDNQAAIVKKDPVARGANVQLETLFDWNDFRSTVFFCKAKGAAKGYTYHETQPFSRSFAGQDWLFMHNGDLDKVKLAAMHTDKSRFLEPVGKTDSELAFCWLLSKVMETEARKLSEIPPETLLEWFEQLDKLGSADMCISDGNTVACFYGTNSTRKLYYSRHQPPDAESRFNSEAISLSLNDPRDTYRTGFILSSSPFDAGSWLVMNPGQLLIVRRGTVMWNSQPNSSQLALSLPVPAGAPAHKQVEDFGSVQAEQAQIHQAVVKFPNAKPHPYSYRTYDLVHSTEYSYSEPVEHSTHIFRVHPLEDHLQEVISSEFFVSSEGEEIRFEDVFGNPSIHYSINKPYKKLSIICKSRVKVFSSPPDDHSQSLRRTNLPLVWMPWQRQMMTPYLLPPELPETELRELTNYAMGCALRNDHNLIETLKDMNLTIYRDYKYVPGITSLNTTPFQVYASRQGVCQDFANLFICLARLLSIPARYRMGYIYTGINYDNKIQSDASHAWVEIYMPYVGWRGFDPTNGCMVDQDHVRVACGRNYIDATPTSGTIYKGGGKETLSVDVKMNEL